MTNPATDTAAVAGANGEAAAAPAVKADDAAVPGVKPDDAAAMEGAGTPSPASEDATAPAAVQVIAPPAVPEGVLVVDDSGHSRELLMSLLRRLTHVAIRQARSGEDALAEFAVRPARLTFLDIDMDGLDGLEVLRRLRALNPDAYVVMVSGVSSVENVRMALDEGAGGFVVKPFRPQRIIDVVAKYVKETGDRAMLIGRGARTPP